MGRADGLPKGGGAQVLKHLKPGQCMRYRPRKVLQAEHEAIALHQEARAAAGGLAPCWGVEAAFSPCQPVSHTVDTPVALAELLLPATHGAVATGTDARGLGFVVVTEATCQEHRQTLGSSGHYCMASSRAHTWFSLKARRPEPTVILPTKRTVEEGDEEIWK